MPIAIPNERPKLSTEGVLKIIRHFKIPEDHALIVVGIRGYYLNAIGAAGQNDRGVYDDAYFLYSRDHCQSFNANADPSSYRAGYGIGDAKGIASLKEQAHYMCKIDLHKGKYEALCQRLGTCTVIRDGIRGPYEQTSAYLGINNHKGGITTTSSLGCQTIPPDQWDEYINLAKAIMQKRHGSLTEEINGKKRYRDLMIPGCLIEEEHRRLL